MTSFTFENPSHLARPFLDLVVPKGVQEFCSHLGSSSTTLSPIEQKELPAQKKWKWLRDQHPEIYLAFYTIKKLCPGVTSHAVKDKCGDMFFSLSKKRADVMNPEKALCLYVPTGGRAPNFLFGNNTPTKAHEVPNHLYHHAAYLGWVEVDKTPDPLTGEALPVLVPGPAQLVRKSFFSKFLT